MKTEELKAKLIHALTAYDRKQAGKRGYNHFALGQYFQRVDLICADVDNGATPRAAILAGFSGRLADVALRVISEAISTREECQSGSLYYQPANRKG